MPIPEFTTKYSELTLELYDPNEDITTERYARVLDEIKSRSGYDMFDKGFKVQFVKDKDQFELALEDSERSGKKVARLTIDKYALHSVANIRHIAGLHNLLCYDLELGLRLPKSHYLMPFSYIINQENFSEVFKDSEYKLTFVYPDPNQKLKLTEYYATKKDGTVHLLNPNMVLFFLEHKDYEPSPELAYQIADSIEDFVAMDDAWILPRDFYRYYKKPHKIINYSSFDVENIDRKVFFHPHVYELGNQQKDLNQLPGGGGLADKVRKGETLDGAIKRVLKDELKIADNYVGACVRNHVEFDRDRDNLLVPRLYVNVFIREAGGGKDMQKTMQRGWRSLDTDQV